MYAECEKYGPMSSHGYVLVGLSKNLLSHIINSSRQGNQLRPASSHLTRDAHSIEFGIKS